MGLRFCLDMDGPCCRFIHGALKALMLEDLIDNYPIGSKNLADITGLSYPTMYKIIDSYGSEFWRNLEETPSFWELYKGLTEIGEVSFCTSPSLASSSAKGKIDWLQDRFGKDFRNYIITNRKYFCANPSTVLIDDTLEMCQEFKSNGGLVIQYPTRLNDLAKNIKEEDRAKYILNKIRNNLWD